MSKINLLEKLTGESRKNLELKIPIDDSQDKKFPEKYQELAQMTISDLELSSSSRFEGKENSLKFSSSLLKSNLTNTKNDEISYNLSDSDEKIEESIKHCPTCTCQESVQSVSQISAHYKTLQESAKPYYSALFKYNAPSQVFRSRLNARYS